MASTPLTCSYGEFMLRSKLTEIILSVFVSFFSVLWSKHWHVNCWREAQQRPPMDWRNEQMCFVHHYQNLSVLLSLPQQRCKETTWTVPFLMSVYLFAHTTWAKVIDFFLSLGGDVGFLGWVSCFWRHWGLVAYIILQINCVLLT